MPKPEDYAPSKWRRLGAALTAGAASFGRDPGNAMALGSEVRDAPLKSAVGSWQLKGAGLKEQADIEAQDIETQRDYVKAMRERYKDELAQFNEQRDYEAKLEDQKIALRNAETTERYWNAQID